ncbi:MAG TPA: GNAT family N-acetyltransferase [Burkholderiales bacterium]|nr:GNAT family N-acetyltransferase [Burkholderiales bacterium]
MNGIRAFRREDIPKVVELWLKVFHNTDQPAPESLRAYFRETFFEAPWRDESLPSLVYEGEDGRIVGFLGVLPRIMKFHGQPIKVAVATQLMTDERARPLYPGVKLMKKFLTGAQSLSFSDGANETSERLWQAAGGDVALLYGLDWSRVLRPVQYAMAQVKRRKPSLLRMAGVLQPLCRLIDTIIVHSGVGRWLRLYWLPEVTDVTVDEEPSADTVLWCVRNLSGKRALEPEYEADCFRWLLKKAAEKTFHGDLRKGVVRDTHGEILGWYLYYLRRGEAGQVLQFGGRPKHIRKVLDCLFLQARKQGAVAVCGGLEPRFSRELAERRCGFAWSGCGVLVQSKKPEVLSAIHRGDAFLTRLEGEWWARFSDPDWPRQQIPSGARVTGGSGVSDTRPVRVG